MTKKAKKNDIKKESNSKQKKRIIKIRAPVILTLGSEWMAWTRATGKGRAESWRVRFSFVSVRWMETRRWDDCEGPSLSLHLRLRQMEQFFCVLPWKICLHAPLFPSGKMFCSAGGHPAQGSQPGGAGKLA